MGKLTAKPVFSGLSRNKILIVAIIILAVVMVLVVGGASFSSSGSNSSPDNNEQSFNSSNLTNQSADAVIKSAQQKIERESNAAQATSLNELTSTSNNNIQASSPSVTNSNVNTTTKIENKSNISVPPISDTDEQQFKTQVVQFQNQYKLKQLQNAQLAYSSKSVIYNNKIKSEASDVAVKNNSQSSSSTSQVPNSTPNFSKENGALLASNAQDQNNQQEKQSFATNSADKTINGQSGQYLASRITDLNSPYVVSAGSVIPSTMMSGLNSDLPGQIVGLVRENVYDSPTHRILLIPQGAKLVGLYDSNVSYGQERILVAWNRLIYPDGSSINLKAMPGTDLEGYAGFKDEIDNHYWKIFGSSFIMGVITGAMQYSQNNTNANVQVGGIGVTTNTNPTVGQTLSGSLGQQLGQTGLTLAQKNINIQPTLIVKPGYPFNVMITADMVLRPYKKS